MKSFTSLAFLFLALCLSHLALAQDKAQPSMARQAADAIQDKHYAAAEKILTGDLVTLATADPQFTPDQLQHLKATSQFLQKNYTAAENSCDALAKQYPKSRWLQKSIFLKAKTYSARNNYEKAIAIYENEAIQLFAITRKAEIAQSLIDFAETFAKQPSPDDLTSPAPDYRKAYKLYSEILDLNCGHQLRASARHQMTRMQSLSNNYSGAETAALAYLKEFDPTWRGLIGSPERVTMKKNAHSLSTGKDIAAVRLLHAEALHRLNRRPEADNYLFELIKLIKDKSITANEALLADATWLRLQTLRKKGGLAYDIDEWKLEAIDYLSSYPKHIHANKTAYILGYLLNQRQQESKAIEAYQDYISDKYQTPVTRKPLTLELESPAAFENRKKQSNTHLEAAHFAIGQIHLNQGDFDLARTAWNQTAQLFPNGSKWADCQKGLVEIDHAQLISELYKLRKETTAANEMERVSKSDTLITTYLSKYPLDPRSAALLQAAGTFPYELGKKLALSESPNKKDRQDRLFTHAIKSWQPLLSKYGQSSQAKETKFLIATLWEEHFANMEKAIEIYRSSKSNNFRTRLAALTNKRLLANSDSAFKLNETPYITLNTRNIEKVTVHQYWLDLESYFLKNGQLDQATQLDVDLVEPDHTWEIAIKDYQKHHPISQQINIPFPKNKPGICIIKIEEDQYFTSGLVMRSNIDLSVRTGKEEIIAYTTNWATGKPAPNVKLLLANGEKIISTEKTGADGVFRKKLPALKDLSNLRVLAIAPEGSATCHQNLSETFSPAAIKPKAWFHTATTDNRPGNIVKFYGAVRETSNGTYTLPKHLNYTLNCRTNEHHTILTTPIKLNTQGGFETEFKIPHYTSSSGIHITLSHATDKKAPVFHHYVPVVRTAPYRASITLTSDQELVNMGDTLTGKIAARYRWGAPVSNRRVRITLPSGNHTDTITDDQGIASFSYDTTGIASGARLNFLAKLIGISSQSTTLSVDVDPLQLYIQAEADKAIVTQGEKVTVKATTRDNLQKLIGSELTLKLIQTKPTDLGLPAQMSRQVETVIQTIPLNTEALTGEGEASFQLNKEGRYILRIEGTDPQGKPSMAETALQVLGENSASVLTAYHSTQELYGDGTAKLRIFSKLKSKASALLTIEADQILSYQLIDVLPGSNELAIPLSSRHAPIFRASIMCMHQRKFYSTEDVFTVGQKLNVKTILPELDTNQSSVGKTMDVRVEVTDTQGQPVPALLMATLTELQKSGKLSPPVVYTPFQREASLPVYSMSTSCGFSYSGSQNTILAALKQEEQRLAADDGRAHRANDLSRLAQQHFQGVDQVRRLLNMGEGYYNLGKYDEAQKSFKKVLQVDMYNKSARIWLERVSSNQSDYYQAAYDHTRSQSSSNGGQRFEFANQMGVSNISTAGLRSGDYATTRNSIDSLLSNPNRNAQVLEEAQGSRNSIDFYLNNPGRESSVRSNALALSRSSNCFQIDPNRINMPIFRSDRNFVGGGTIGNGIARKGADFISPVNSARILGIPANQSSYLLPELPNSVGTSNLATANGASPLATNFFFTSHIEQAHHWASSINLVTTGISDFKLPLPQQAGQWKLTVLAAGNAGRLGMDTQTITTHSPVTLRFSPLAEVMVKDKLTPILTLYRHTSDLKQSFKITGSIEIEGVTKLPINQTVELDKNSASFELKLPEIKITGEGIIKMNAQLTHVGQKYSCQQSTPIRPYGAAVASRHTESVTPGNTEWKISLPEGAQPHHLILTPRKDVSTALYQLAATPNESIFGWKIPCRQSHPAGQLLAQVAVLNYLTQQGAIKTPEYQDLLQLTRWTLNELTEMQNTDGSWSSVRGRKRSSLITTATAYEALQRWNSLKLNTSKSTQSTKTWLKKKLGKLNSQQTDDRCLIQHSLSYGEAADFSVCNRLYRDRGALGDAGRVLLAQAFINLKRPSFAKTLIEGMHPPKQWSSNSDPLTQHPAWLAGQTLSVISTLAASDPSLKKQGASLYQKILSQAGASGFTNDFVRGPAVAGLAAWVKKSDPADYKVTIFLNGKELHSLSSDNVDQFAPIYVPSNLIKKGENTIKTSMQGKGSLYLSASLTGVLTEFPKIKTEKFAVLNRHYYQESPNFKGQPLKASGYSITKQVEFQSIIRVAVQLNNQIKSQKEVTLVEHLPAGFTYLAGSLRGNHSGARVEHNQLIVTFQDNFKPRWIHYQLIASHPGTWTQAPSAFFPVHAPAMATFGKMGSLVVLPAGKASNELYKLSTGEHKELAQLHYQHGEYPQARKHLSALRQMDKRYSEDAQIAKITLWLETEQAQPDAKLLVEAFETLDAKMPELSIPFDKILKVGQAYRNLKEYERGHYVFEATLEAGFAQDTYVGAALEDQGRFLDAIDYQKRIWMLYPNNGEITNTWFAMAQQLYDRSSKAATIKPRITDAKDKRIKEADMIAESQQMLNQFLTLHPEHPSADDVSYTMANTLFALKDYHGVVTHARRCHNRYTKSKYLSSFRYMEALGSFWLRDYDVAIKAAAEVAHGTSQDKDLATFITAQIFHAKGQPTKAIEWYTPIKNQYPDALESIAYFEQKKITLDEVKVLPSGKNASIKMSYRNIKNAQLKIYRVDLMKLYLKQKNLSNITNIELAGIAPKHELTVKLPQGDMTEDIDKTINLPLKEDGAYLIICRGDYLYTSGLVLITPLKLEVQEEPGASSLRVHIKDQQTGKLLDNVHVKAIGSNNHTFQNGETDLRGIWKAESLTGKPTVIARDTRGRYAFFRSELNYSGDANGSNDDTFAVPADKQSKKIDFKGNLEKGQFDLNLRNHKSYNQFRRGKGKGVKVNKAMKK